MQSPSDASAMSKVEDYLSDTVSREPSIYSAAVMTADGLPLIVLMGKGEDKAIQGLVRHAVELPGEGFIEKLCNFFGELWSLGSDIFWPLMIGCVVVGIVCAVPTYFIMDRAVTRFRERRAARRAKRQEKV